MERKIGPRDVPADRWMLLSVSVVVHDDGADLDEPVVHKSFYVSDLDLVPGTGLLDELAGLARGDGAYLGAGGGSGGANRRRMEKHLPLPVP